MKAHFFSELPCPQLTLVKRGAVDQLLDVAVERPRLNHFEIEVRRSLEDGFGTSSARDNREDCNPYKVN